MKGFLILIYFLGKSLLMKERTFRAKKLGRDVTFMSLGSCDVFGIPSKFALVYDLITKREMRNFGIDFMNANDLVKSCRNNVLHEKEDDNRQFVMDNVGKALRGEMSSAEFVQNLKQRGIDIGNAIEFYHEHKNNPLRSLLENVYDKLVEYCKLNNQRDINIDEFPVLMNYKSKFIFSSIFMQYQ